MITETVTVLKCKNGHIIPTNMDVKFDKQGNPNVSRNHGINGESLMNSRLVCEQCAIAAGGIVYRKKRAAKGRDLDKLGQETGLETWPSISVR